MMPKRVLLVAVVFILTGLLSIYQILWSLLHNPINLNFGVFLLPVGIGLLRRRASSLKWANRWLIFGYFAWPFVCAVATLGKGLPHDRDLVVLMSLVGLIANWALHWAIRSEKTQAFFGTSRQSGHFVPMMAMLRLRPSRRVPFEKSGEPAEPRF